MFNIKFEDENFVQGTLNTEERSVAHKITEALCASFPNKRIITYENDVRVAVGINMTSCGNEQIALFPTPDGDLM